MTFFKHFSGTQLILAEKDHHLDFTSVNRKSCQAAQSLSKSCIVLMDALILLFFIGIRISYA